jgi:hypothetical protein
MRQDLTRSSQDLSLPSHPFARRVTQTTTPPHLSATRVNPSPHCRPCSGQRTGSSTSKSTPLLCLSDQTNARTSTTAPHVFPRRACSLSRAPPPPSDPQPVLYPTLTPGRFRSNTQTPRDTSTLLAQPLLPSRPLDAAATVEHMRAHM